MATANEILHDEAVNYAIQLHRYSNGEVRRIIALLNRADAQLTAELDAAIARNAPQATIDHIDVVLQQVRAINAEAYRQVGATLTAHLAEFTAYTVGKELGIIRLALPGGARAVVDLQGVSPAQVNAAAMARPFQGRLLREWMADLETARAAKIRDAVRIGIVNGDTTEKIVRTIRGTRANGYVDGLLERPRADLETIVRSAISHTAAYAREQVVQANADIVKASRWVSTLDNRTTQLCRVRDGHTYSTEKHKPLDGGPPWGAGPGQLHFNAIPAGSLVQTRCGLVPIERIRVGDDVLTHRGRFKPVVDVRGKRNEIGVVRVVHTEAGRIFRATDDHPVFVDGRGWVFAGTLEVGDALFHDPQHTNEIGRVAGQVVPESEYGPAVPDEAGITGGRTRQLAASGIGFNCDLDGWEREVDNVIRSLVLKYPSAVESQSVLHQLFALTWMIGEERGHALREFLANSVLHGNSAPHIADAFIGAASDLGGLHARHDFRMCGRVVLLHALSVAGVKLARFLAHTIGPMFASAPVFAGSTGEVASSLLLFGSNGDALDGGEPGKRPVGDSVLTLNAAQGMSLFDMQVKDEGRIIGQRFGHDRVSALYVQDYSGDVYDLEVSDDASYVCNGIVVSNCRSVSVPVLKSWRELGLKDPSPATRASMDGAVPAEMNYAEWLAKQPMERVEEILGPIRARLYKKGGLKLAQFSNNKGELYTLDELRKLDAAAFAKAGL
jgi:hypothetical protein